MKAIIVNEKVIMSVPDDSILIEQAKRSSMKVDVLWANRPKHNMLLVGSDNDDDINKLVWPVS